MKPSFLTVNQNRMLSLCLASWHLSHSHSLILTHKHRPFMIKLTEENLLMLSPLIARERQLLDLYHKVTAAMEKHRADFKVCDAYLEKSHGIPSGSIGTTHTLQPDGEDWYLVEQPKKAEQTAPPKETPQDRIIKAAVKATRKKPIIKRKK